MSSIDKNAFDNCSKLYAASFERMSAPALGTSVFDGCHASFKIYYSTGATGYDSLGYPAVAGKAPIIGDGYCFDTDSGTLTISSISGMTNWRNNSGILMSSVKSIVVESEVSNIEDEAFEGCTSLSTISIPESVTSIGSRAFDGCSSLLTVTIPNNVDSIERCAFRNCTSLTTVTIPHKVISIGADAFYGCAQLTSAIFKPIAAPALGASVFDGCHASFKIYYPANGTGYEDLGYPAEASGSSSGGGSRSSYCSRNLTDSAAGITVSGSGIHRFAQLAIRTLDAQSLPASMREAITSGQVIAGYDITLSGGFRGEITLSFPVGAAYEG